MAVWCCYNRQVTERGGRAGTALGRRQPDAGRWSIAGRPPPAQLLLGVDRSSPGFWRGTASHEWPAILAVDIVALSGPLWMSLDYWRGTAAMGTAALVLFAQGGLYRRRLHAGFLDELPSLLSR